MKQQIIFNIKDIRNKYIVKLEREREREKSREREKRIKR